MKPFYHSDFPPSLIHNFAFERSNDYLESYSPAVDGLPLKTLSFLQAEHRIFPGGTLAVPELYDPIYAANRSH